MTVSRETSGPPTPAPLRKEKGSGPEYEGQSLWRSGTVVAPSFEAQAAEPVNPLDAMYAAMRAEFRALRPWGGFQFIMADPPWHFEEYSEAGDKTKSINSQYDTMTIPEICGMPVQELCAHDCVLWLWTTNPHLRNAMDVIDAWGFEFKTAGSWDKETVTGKQHFGNGHWLRSSNEPFLIATKGKPRVQCRSIRSSFRDRVRGHSRKPDRAFGLAERMSPGQARIELFSRQSRCGWVTWGNEATKFDGECNGG